MSVDAKKKQFHAESYAKNYDRSRFRFGYRLAFESIFGKQLLAKINENHIVLDYGCGTGHYTLKLVRKGILTVSIDISRTMLSILRSKLSGEKHVHLILADGENLPLKNEAFDVVISMGVLHHLPNVYEGLKEISRVLKKKGLFHARETRKTSLESLMNFFPSPFMTLTKKYEKNTRI